MDAYITILMHWVSEWLMFHTIRFDAGYVFSAGVDALGFVWMYYIEIGTWAPLSGFKK